MEGPEDAARPQINEQQSSTKSATSSVPSSNRAKRRATRACDRCKQKKMRCTGKHPCSHCTAVNTNCEYNAKYTRGKAPPIPPAFQGDQTQHLAGVVLETGITSSGPRQSSGYLSERSSSERAEPGRQARAQPNNQDNDPSNCASIYRRTESNLNRAISHQTKIPVFAYGDPPVPDVDISFLVLPPPDLARDLVAKYFEVVAPTNRFLHHGTVEFWLNDVLRSFRGGHDGENSRRAIVLLVIASSYNHRDVSSDEEDSDLSFRYFQAADHQLRTETGEVRLESIQARLLQCFYLLSRSRIHQSWSIFGTVVNQIYAIDLHRKAKSERTASEDWINTECRKRAFWAAYTLDKYLSLTLGRPQQFHDEDIDQELPLLVNDEHLSSTNYMVTRDELHSTMKASIYQNKLAIILGAILRDLYGIRPKSFEARLSLAQKHRTTLEQLALTAISFMALDTSNLRILFSRQILGLKLSYAHVLIVLFRPFLLDNHLPGNDLSPDLREKYEDSVVECLKAALGITGYINSLYEGDASFCASWFFHFCGYTAVVALYVYVIKRQSEPEDTWMPIFKAAERCQGQIKIAAEKESFSQKCSQVLEELHAEAMSHIRRKNRQEEQGEALRRQTDNQPQHLRSEQPQYSEQFASTPAASAPRQSPKIPEFTFGSDWQDMSFDQTAPGGGILGSMDWIPMQSPSSVVEKIEQWGFPSLTGW